MCRETKYGTCGGGRQFRANVGDVAQEPRLCADNERGSSFGDANRQGVRQPFRQVFFEAQGDGDFQRNDADADGFLHQNSQRFGERGFPFSSTSRGRLPQSAFGLRMSVDNRLLRRQSRQGERHSRRPADF